MGKFEKVATAVEASKKDKIDFKKVCTLIISVLLNLLTRIIIVLLPLLKPMQVLHLNYSLVFPSVKEVTLSANSSISSVFFILFATPFFIP